MKRTIVFLMLICGFCFSQLIQAQTVTGAEESQDISAQVVDQQSGSQLKQAFTDKNGDGVCDNRPGRGLRNRNFVDANNDGICDNIASRPERGKGRNFVDADNDGICDHFREGRPGRGAGNGYCRGNGKGNRYRNGQR